jgi:hypothetical protein
MERDVARHLFAAFRAFALYLASDPSTAHTPQGGMSYPYYCSDWLQSATQTHSVAARQP